MQQGPLQATVLRVYSWLLIAPLKKLYFGGPQLFGYGFWAGREPSDACAELTNVGAEFWSQHPDRCEDLLNKQFTAFLIAIETLAYLYLLYRSISFVIRVILWKLRLSPESWRRTPPFVLDQAPAIAFKRGRGRSPQARSRKKSQ